MTYLLTGLVLVLLASGLAMAIWVSGLKDRALHWMTLHAQVAGELSRQKLRAEAYLAQRRRAEAQLETLRKNHDELSKTVESGALCDADGIAAFLRGMPDSDA